HAFEADAEGAMAARSIAAPRHLDALALHTEEELLLPILRDLLPRDIETDLAGLRRGLGDAERPAITARHRGGPRGDGSLSNREVLVHDHELGIDLRPHTQAVACGTHPERGVEREARRAELRIALATTCAIRTEGDARFGTAAVVRRDQHLALRF